MRQTLLVAAASTRILKRLVQPHPEAKALVTFTLNKNVWEAWRQLHCKFDPRNDAASNNIVQRLMDASKWQCKTLGQIPVKIAQWEGLQHEYQARHGDQVLSHASKKEILLNMIPASMKEHIRVQTLLMKREDLTFEKIRMFVSILRSRWPTLLRRWTSHLWRPSRS